MSRIYGFFKGPVFSLRALIRCGLLALAVCPGPAFAQSSPVENAWGLDYEGRAIVAVLPLAGEETDMIRRFHEGLITAVAALETYNPREVHESVFTGPEIEIPTDMPPSRNLVPGVRYALTGGVYPGGRAGEYYLQLWLWDMTGTTMIYTDDLVYDDMEGAMESLPGLVEWLFSHIYEVTVEAPAPDTWRDPFFMLGFRAGISPRWYISPDESPGARALNPEGGISGALRLGSLFSIQLELLLGGDTMVNWGLNWEEDQYILANEQFTSLTMMIPLLGKMNLRTGPVRLSPLAGLYVIAPLGKTRYRLSPDGEEQEYSPSFSVPLGVTAGLEGAIQYGPGRLLAGLRYAGDFGNITIDDDPKTSYRRSMVSVYLGYEFGFLETKK
jgi:hypothetical protein